MVNVEINKDTPDEFSGCSLDGLSIPIYVQHTTANTAWSGAICDLSKGRVKVVLKGRYAKDVVIIPNMTFQDMLYLAALERPEYEYFNSMSVVDVLEAEASGVKAKGLIPLKIPFGSAINLKGSEKIEVVYKLDNGFFSAQVDTANSYMMADKMDTVGVEEYTPTFDVHVVQQGEGSKNYALGNNVTRIVLANYNKSSVLAADQVLSDLDITSDKWGFSAKPYQLYAQQLDVYPTKAAARARYQSYLLYDGKELDGVQMDVSWNKTNVAASANMILVRSFVTSKELVIRAAQMHQVHQAKDLMKIGIAAPMLK